MGGVIAGTGPELLARVFGPDRVGTVRRECLDWMHVLGERHLEQVLHAYAAHYNTARPHRALRLRSPVARGHPVPPGGEIDRLGVLIHEYERRAA